MTGQAAPDHEAVTITVGGEHPYPVTVGWGLLARAPQTCLNEVPSALRIAVIHPLRQRERGRSLAAALREGGRRPTLIEIPDGEQAKTTDVAAMCWEALGAAGFTRSDAIIALGGGAITDLAGFVAGTWLRGVPVVHLPTTLLAMVDAAVGGKTGINTAAGKNLVGVFHPPAAVICDLETLTTLPPADRAAGLAEVIKAGFIRDPAILALIEADPAAALEPTSRLLRVLIERAVAVKARVVSGDLRETSGGSEGREILNYGHTLGHAIEHAEEYRWRHGEAVAVGMVFAAELGRAAGLLDAEAVDRHRRILASVGLPTSYPHPGRLGQLRSIMALDKKARGDALAFIVLTGIGEPTRLVDPPEEVLAEAWQRVSGASPASSTEEACT